MLGIPVFYGILYINLMFFAHKSSVDNQILRMFEVCPIFEKTRALSGPTALPQQAAAPSAKPSDVVPGRFIEVLGLMGKC